MKDNKTAIIILTYNNLQYNKECLESIRKYTKEGTYEVIIVDNCSTDGTRDWLKEQTDIKLLLNDENVGFPKGCNMGIELAEKDSDILLLNNDIVVTPRWLDNLRICLYSDEKIGAVGAMCNQFANHQGIEGAYTNNDELVQFADKINISDISKWEEKNFLIGFCKLIKRAVLDKIGGLDERYSPGYVEDNDLSISIINEGYKLMLCHDVFIHHYLGTSFRKDWNKFWTLVIGNRYKFQEKWGFHTDKFEDIRFDLIRLMDEANHEKEMNILDVGCSVGGTLLKIKKDYPNIKMYGIENDMNIRKIVKNFMNISSKSVGEFPLDFPQQHFDYIIINNELEFTEDPVMLLSELKKYLKPSGFIIASVKNIMHFSVLRNIIKGSWRYAEGDIIDRSSRNYFTADDIVKLFSGCGFVNPFIFHWFSSYNDEEKELLQTILNVAGNDRGHLFSTTQFSIKFQKPQ